MKCKPHIYSVYYTAHHWCLTMKNYKQINRNQFIFKFNFSIPLVLYEVIFFVFGILLVISSQQIN